ncbi:uncharacterized protein LOC143289479 [Babylonia areolata]|uniref:uncharacterized protein LOC143289479 n=1 Tax=Babylonia areolata TaxID=304850 RepID=UPI003FD67CEC
MAALTSVFLVTLVAMATHARPPRAGLEEEVAPADMNLHQAQAMFQQTFHEMDKNHDHLVDFREFMEPYLVHDHDNNMAVTLQEFLQQAPAEENQEVLSADFRFHDTNHDNTITVQEMRDQFDTIDTNENQEISQEEFVAFGTVLFTDKSHPSFEESPVGK